DADDYERLNLMADVLSLDLSVSIDRSQSPPVVRVRSQRPARDPVIQLLVDARWSSGRILRGYTLFLDPPTITAAPPARSVSEPASAQQPSVVSRPARQTASDPAPQSGIAAAAPLPVMSGDRYSVQPGDTLWSVAQNVRPNAQLSMSQTMLAIVEMNPSAFRDGSIHQMYSGAQLELPDREQIDRIDQQMAEQIVAQQNRAFNQRMNASVPVIAEDNPPVAEPLIEPELAVEQTPDQSASPTQESQTATAEGDTSIDVSSAEEFRLELVPPAENDEGLGLSAEEREANRLRQQLAREEEERFTAQLEAEQLQERVAQLETMINDNPSGIGIRDFNLAQLEQTLRAARRAASEQADPALRAEITGQVDEYLQQFAAVSADGPGTQSMADETGSQADSTPVVTQIGESRWGLSGWFGNLWILFIIGMIALLMVLLALWFWRKRVHDAQAGETMVTAAKPKPKPKPVQSFDRAEPVSPQVQYQPDDLDAQLELLRLLAEREDISRFSTALEYMYNQVEHDDQYEWQQALVLAKRVVPDHPLVAGGSDWDPESDDTNNVDLIAKPEIENEKFDSLVNDLQGLSGLLTEEELNEIEVSEAYKQSSGTLDTPLLHEDDREGTWQPSDDVLPLELQDDSVEANEFEARRIAENEGDSADEEPLSIYWPEANEGDAMAVASSEVDEATEASVDDNSLQNEQDDIFSTGDDDVEVKLDLARAYLSWNSTDSARALLEEIAQQGNDQQRKQAKQLLDDIE
ncbi:MAG: FimV/HubP family polar landmark protein, partial [Pseudomonadota bacterium]